jgi:cell division protein ZapA (FtsZ GTPase activity inhibitor)
VTKGRVVHVHIHGQQYAVRSELDPQYVGELAAYVASADVVRVSVVAALNIADELFRARADRQSPDERHWASRAADLERLVDAALGEPPAPAIAAAGA